jgi:hypothetical protein
VRKFCERLVFWPRKPPAPHATARLRAGATALIVAAATPLAWPATSNAEDADWIVIAVARDATWGMGIAATQGRAIAAAKHDCLRKAGAASDCGALTKATRDGWIIANMCGDRRIIVAADTQEAAEQAALLREIDLAEANSGYLPACGPVLTVGPAGPDIGSRTTTRLP